MDLLKLQKICSVLICGLFIIFLIFNRLLELIQSGYIYIFIYFLFPLLIIVYLISIIIYSTNKKYVKLKKSSLIFVASFCIICLPTLILNLIIKC